MNDISIFCLVASISMLIHSFAGFGGGLIAMPLLVLVFTPAEIAPVYVLSMAVLNFLLLIEARQYVNWRVVVIWLLGGFIGVPIGIYGLKYLSPVILGLIVGFVTLAFAVFFLSGRTVNFKSNASSCLGVGLFSGLLGGCIAQSGPPVLIYGLSQKWNKNQFRATLLAYFTGLSIITCVGYIVAGMISSRGFLMSAAGIVPMILACYMGTVLKNRTGEKNFKLVVLLVVLFASVLSIAKYLMYWCT